MEEVRPAEIPEPVAEILPPVEIVEEKTTPVVDPVAEVPPAAEVPLGHQEVRAALRAEARRRRVLPHHRRGPRLAPGAALFLLNSKKRDLNELETHYGAKIFVLADGRLRADEYEFEFESSREQRTTVQHGHVSIPEPASSVEDDSSAGEPAEEVT